MTVEGDQMVIGGDDEDAVASDPWGVAAADFALPDTRSCADVDGCHAAAEIHGDEEAFVDDGEGFDVGEAVEAAEILVGVKGF